MKKILHIGIAALMMGACSKSTESVEPTTQMRAVEFSVGVDTRVTSDSKWETGDEIGVFAGDSYKNKKYVMVEAKDEMTIGTLRAANTDNAIQFGEGVSSMDFFAYYPYDCATLNSDKLDINISGENNKPVIIARNPNVTSTTDPISLAFTYVVAKLTVTIHEGKYDFTNGEEVTIYLSNASTKGALNVTNDSWSDPQTLQVKRVKSVDRSIDSVEFNLYIIPNGEQTPNITIKYGENLHSHTIAATTFVAGESYTSKINLINEPSSK